MISIIIPYRNREISRIERCLTSLSAQTYNNFEVIFVDNGSDKQQAKDVSELVAKFTFCKYIFSDTRGLIWNRGYALNIGIRNSNAELILMADIDLIFAPDFLMHINTLNTENKFYNYRCIYLPESFNYQPLSWNYTNYEKLRNSGDSRGLLVVNRKQVLELQGYDPFSQHWGCEDDDMCKRLIASGLTQNYLDLSQFLSLHQWHAESNSKWPASWYLHMLMYCNENTQIKRNPAGFGQLIHSSDRLIHTIDSSSNDYSQVKLSSYVSVTCLNGIISSFYATKPNGLIKIAYDTPPELSAQRSIKRIKQVILNFIIKPGYHYNELMEKKYLTVEKLYDFLLLFIGSNRSNILDYSMSYIPGKSIVLTILKK
jgi:glycosyltransferase involved in cell wall biosynthesis